MLAAVAHLIWTVSLRRTLDRQLAAYKAAGEPVERTDFIGYGVVPGDNAVPDLQAATQPINPTSPAWDAFDEADLTPPFPLRPDEITMLRAMVVESADALPLLESASSKPGVDWELSYEGSVISIMLPSLNGYRNLANVARADALVAHTAGDDARAVRRASQVLFLSRAMGRQPILVSHLVSVGMTAMSAQLVVDLSPDLRIGTAPGDASVEQVRALLAELLDESHAARSQQDAFLGERMFQLEMIRMLQNGSLGLDGKSRQRGVPMLGYLLVPTFLDDAGLATRYTTGLRQASATSPDLPTFKRTAPTIPPSVQQQWWRHIAARIVMPSLDRAIETHYRGLADRRMAAVALAARMYALDHGGRLPKSLDELVPKYLPSVPLDPTSNGQPIRYSGDDDPDPRIWTIGENERDDDGKDTVPTKSAKWNKENIDRVVHLRRQPRPAPPPPLPVDEFEPATGPTSLPAAD